MISKEDITQILNEEDYYKLLGVEKTAKTQDIEKAFRKLSVKWHPDKVKIKDETLREETTKVFKKLNEAKEILTDETKREIYDRYGIEGLKERGNEMHPEHNQEMMQEFMKQMFGNQFGNMNRSNVPDINIIEELTLEELYTGKEYKKQIDRYSLCKDCNGYGSEDGLNHECKDCGGTGMQIKVVRMGNMMQQSQQTCSLCKGSGSDSKVKKCNKCEGKKLIKEKSNITIKIPKGAYGGVVLTMKGEGNEIPLNERNRGNNKKRSDINIRIKEKSHTLYERGFIIPEIKETKHPKDLKMSMTISLVESLTGFTKSIKTISGKTVNIVHEKLIKHRDVLVIPKLGMPVLEKNTEIGNLYIVFNIDAPDELNITTRRRIWQLLTNTPYKDLSPNSIENTVLMEPSEKYKYDNYRNPDLYNNYNSFGTSNDDENDSEQKPADCKVQ